VREACFVTAFVEVGPEFLREDGRVVAEDEGKGNAQSDLPGEESVALGYRLTREGTLPLDERHFFGREGAHVVFASESSGGDHGSDAVGLEVDIMRVAGHLAEELYTGVLPDGSLIVGGDGAELLALDEIVEIEILVVVGDNDACLGLVGKPVGPVHVVNQTFHNQTG